MKIYRYWDIQCHKSYKINSSQISNLQSSNVQRIYSRPYEQFYPVQQTYNQMNIPFYGNKQIEMQNPLSISNQSVPTSGKPQTTTIYQYNQPLQYNRQPTFYHPPFLQPNQVYPPLQRPNLSPPPKQSSLAQQFSKPLLMKKNSVNETERINQTSFKKRKPNVVFQSQMMSPPVASTQPSKSLPKHHQYQQPQISINNKNTVTFSQNLQSHQNRRPVSQGSIQTPKFSYQTPNFNQNSISSSSNYGYVQNSIRGNQNLIGSFNINNSVIQSQSHSQSQLQFSLQPKMQAQFVSSMQNKPQFNSHTPNFNLMSNSPSSTGNSPILTKSIINPI